MGAGVVLLMDVSVCDSVLMDDALGVVLLDAWCGAGAAG